VNRLILAAGTALAVAVITAARAANRRRERRAWLTGVIGSLTEEEAMELAPSLRKVSAS
jgi:cob(I)alamin adenosyltransferase